ncbi:hypothetical protein HK097_008672, partial [Rhizophlyctis rosea]
MDTDELPTPSMGQYRIKVQQETYRIVSSKTPSYTASDGSTVTLSLSTLLGPTTHTQTYTTAPKLLPTSASLHFTTPIVYVTEGDCLTVAQELKNNGLNPVVLNMANAEHPGGGWQWGAGAQEENMFRRSNYVMHLVTVEEKNGRWGTKAKYPIPEFGGIYSPDVVVFRGEEKDKYPFLPSPFT